MSLFSAQEHLAPVANIAQPTFANFVSVGYNGTNGAVAAAFSQIMDMEIQMTQALAVPLKLTSVEKNSAPLQGKAADFDTGRSGGIV